MKNAILLTFTCVCLFSLGLYLGCSLQDDEVNASNNDLNGNTIYANEVHAKKFVLTDPTGQIRGGLALDDEGTATLNLLDKAGNNKVLIALDDEVTHFILVGPDEEHINISLHEGFSELKLRYKENSVRLFAGTAHDTREGVGFTLESIGGEIAIITDDTLGSAFYINNNIDNKNFSAP